MSTRTALRTLAPAGDSITLVIVVVGALTDAAGGRTTVLTVVVELVTRIGLTVVGTVVRVGAGCAAGWVVRTIAAVVVTTVVVGSTVELGPVSGGSVITVVGERVVLDEAELDGRVDVEELDAVDEEADELDELVDDVVAALVGPVIAHTPTTANAAPTTARPISRFGCLRCKLVLIGSTNRQIVVRRCRLDASSSLVSPAAVGGATADCAPDNRS